MKRKNKSKQSAKVSTGRRSNYVNIVVKLNGVEVFRAETDQAYLNVTYEGQVQTAVGGDCIIDLPVHTTVVPPQ